VAEILVEEFLEPLEITQGEFAEAVGGFPVTMSTNPAMDAVQ
jgi:plasmid maintenance system antidote protein VapI